jgi:hypothetical protein
MDTTKSTQSDVRPESAPSIRHAGGCHCGAVRFTVELDPSKPASRCNCSICMKMGVTGAIVKPEAFVLLSGEQSLSTYEWGHRTGKRFFCKHCGIHCFGKGHLDVLGGDYVSVALNVLDGVDVSKLETIHWDGRHDNWMAGPRKEPWPLARETAAATA